MQQPSNQSSFVIKNNDKEYFLCIQSNKLGKISKYFENMCSGVYKTNDVLQTDFDPLYVGKILEKIANDVKIGVESWEDLKNIILVFDYYSIDLNHLEKPKINIPKDEYISLIHFLYENQMGNESIHDFLAGDFPHDLAFNDIPFRSDFTEYLRTKYINNYIMVRNNDSIEIWNIETNTLHKKFLLTDLSKEDLGCNIYLLNDLKTLVFRELSYLVFYDDGIISKHYIEDYSFSIRLTPDHKRIILKGPENCKVLTIEDKSIIELKTEHSQMLSTNHVLVNNHTITFFKNMSILSYDLDGGKFKNIVGLHPFLDHSYATFNISNNHRFLAVCYISSYMMEGSFSLIDIEQNKPIIQNKVYGTSFKIDFSPDDNFVICEDLRANIYKVSDGNMHGYFGGDKYPNTYFVDSHHIAVSIKDGTTEIINLMTWDTKKYNVDRSNFLFLVNRSPINDQLIVHKNHDRVIIQNSDGKETIIPGLFMQHVVKK